jgi:Protein of unknown function (DUF3592)
MSGFSSSTFGSYAGKWLIGTGIFEIVLAAIFLFIGLMEPILRGGFALTAAILGGTGLILIWFGLRSRRSAAEAERIVRSGLQGTAQVTSLSQTGMTLNDQPQIEMELLVTVPGRAPYTARRKEFVPLILLGRLGSGMPLPVRVDPADPQQVIIDWQASGTTPLAAPAGGAAAGQTETLAQVQAALAASGMPAAAPYATPDQGSYTVDQLRAAVRATGIEGTATIEKVADTGEVGGDERLFTMEVSVHLPGQPDRRDGPSAAMVPLAAANKVRVGLQVPVKVARDNPNVVLFEWDKLTGGSTTMI